eukprot:3047838-Rhodomonas_salina.1
MCQEWSVARLKGADGQTLLVTFQSEVLVEICDRPLWLSDDDCHLAALLLSLKAAVGSTNPSAMSILKG